MAKRVKQKKRRVRVRAPKVTEPKYLDTIKFVDDYLGMQDWRVRENANIAYSFSSLFLQAAGETIARYTLSRVYPREVARAHLGGDFHIHNLPFGITGYCAGWSIKDLLLQGFSGVPGRTESSPSRHFSSALLQISNFLGSVQNEWAGAQAVNSLDVYLAPFVRKDGLRYKQVKQAMQEFIYNLNISCFDDKTEILTRSGFKPFDALTEEDFVLTMNPATLEIEFQNPTRVIKQAYNGSMLHIKNSTFDFLVTPNHRFFVARQRSHKKRRFKFVRADELKYNDRIPKRSIWKGEEVELFRLPGFEEVYKFYSPFSGKWHKRKAVYEEKAIKMDDWLAFLGIYLAEGSCIHRKQKRKGYEVIVHQIQHKDEVRATLKKLPFKFSEEEDRFTIYDKQLWHYLEKLGDHYSKHIPLQFKELGKKQLRILLDSLVLGDGYSGKYTAYYTSSEQLADDVCELAIKLGLNPRVFKRYSEGVITKRTVRSARPNRMVKLKSSKWFTFGTLRGENGFIQVEKIPYKGKVYCCAVPNEIILVRRNGICTWSGNSRWGGQSPFTNVTFELQVPEDMKKEPVIYGGKTLEETYADYQSEADLINRAFLDVMLHGDMRQRIFTFPIPTFNVTKDFDWESEISDLLFETTAKFGIPYFQNCVKGGIDPREVRAMCCRLMLDLKELHRRYGGFFGFADKTGSVGVCTINMPRLGYVSKSERDFFNRLERLMELAKNSLEIKRKLVEENMKRGLLPFSARYLGTLKFHFSTIGLVGMHEACLNFLGEGIETKTGKEFAIKVLKFMRKKLLEFQEETGNIYNLEATPAEGTSHRLARLDKKQYPKIITSGKKTPYYTNSTHLPVGYTDNLFEALRHQDDLQVLYNGGTVFHTFLGEAVSSTEGCKVLVRRMAENFRLPYYTITPTFSICMEHGYLRGENFECPRCGKPAEVYSRVVGYFRPVRNWHVGKQEEFKDRLDYDEKASVKGT